ncbi:ribosome biosynthesis protein LTO1, partial [Cyberlindnera jadinii NRRL Y-1542]
MDFDEVNTLEEQFYNEGFKEGQEASVKESLKEGKEYGLQTGFQRFLLVGQVTALVDHMESVYGVDCGTHMAQLRELVESINFDNDYNTVVAMDKLISKIRNKVRIL